MSFIQADFYATPAARVSLKRGLARQAMSHAAGNQADLHELLVVLDCLRPNAKARERMARRIKAMRGVVRVTSKGDALVILVRNQAEITTAAEEVAVFSETSLIYTRLTARCEGGRCIYDMSRASFSLHALQRLVERGGVALDRALLPVVDGEAAGILRTLSKDSFIREDEDVFAQAGVPGLWAGAVDGMALDPEWGLRHKDADVRVPVFSVRTFLSPDEMRPMVWMRWNEGQGMPSKSPRR